MQGVAGMRHTAAMSTNATGQFTERGFYLGEFRGRTLGFVLAPGEVWDPAPLVSVFGDLVKNESRVVILAPDADCAFRLGAVSTCDDSGSSWPGVVWRGLREHGCVVVEVGEQAFAERVRAVALRLRLGKLVWLRSEGGLRGAAQRPISFMDLGELRRYRQEAGDGDPVIPLLTEVERLLQGGIPSVNVCSAQGLDAELFTYAGSGTLFTRDRYADVRALSVDDFDAAHDLIARGVDEGYLVERDGEALDRVLAGAIGVFVEGRHLAGVGALLPHPEDEAAEIASLYTVTRYLGGGIGHQIVAFAVERARSAGLDYVFACTTSEQVAAFFERSGFRRVDGDAIPEAKWRGYPAERRNKVMCLRLDLGD